jgi:hypothetical protein
VRRKAVVLAALSAALVTAPQAAAQATLLMPGVTYERSVQFTPHGPVVAHVLRAPRPNGGLHTLRPVLSNEAIVGRERVTAMQRRVSPQATVAGVNGDLFNWAVGYPSGMLMMGGVLAATPQADRSSLGIGVDGSLRVDRVRYAGTWQGAGQRRPVSLNRDPAPGAVTLYTPAWGPTTPARQDTIEAVLGAFPPAAPGRDLPGQVIQLKQGGNTPIPPGSAVLVGRGTGAGRIAAEAPLGSTVTVRLTLSPDWSSLAHAVGGGPVLVRAGRAVFRSNEAFTADQLVPRHPRTAVGQSADGRLILVTVDGRQPGYSVGMTNFELALTLARLGAVTASALDGGGSTTMAFDGRLLNRPSDPGGEREVAEGLFVFYTGVYVPALPEEVVSPNGDGVGERQSLAYKLVRQSNVNARLAGPAGVEQPLDAGNRGPGTYRFQWAPGGAPQGKWKLVVDAVDDQGQASSAERAFSVNSTLGALRVSPSTLALRRRGSTLRATFTLARQARVSATVATASGAFVRSLRSRSLPAGGRALAWNGRDARGLLVHTGRYVIRVAAQNELGTATLTASFGVRRVRGR